jgi:hypothetical protein
MPAALDPTLDMILGIAFCKWISVLLYHQKLKSNLTFHDPVTNVYLLLDYGDCIDTTTNNTTSPYVQFLSMTDPSTAHNEFVAMRLNGTNPLGTNQSTGSQNGNSSGCMAEDLLEKYKTLFILPSAVVLLS